MYIVQIRGANGSGKTTIVKQLLSLSSQKEYLKWEENCKGRPQVFSTVCKDIEWAAIGIYPRNKQMGGCDHFKSMDDIKMAIMDTYLTYPNLFGIVFEGMMITAVKTPFYNFLLEMERDFCIHPLFVNLHSTQEGCLERIDARGTRKAGAKPINLKLLNIKLTATERYGNFFGKYSRWIDVESTPKSHMLKLFLTLVGDEELVSQI